MNAITLQFSDEMHRKVKAIAAERGVSVDSLLAQMAETMITEHEAEKRFRARAARGAGREADALELLNRD